MKGVVNMEHSGCLLTVEHGQNLALFVRQGNESICLGTGRDKRLLGDNWQRFSICIVPFKVDPAVRGLDTHHASPQATPSQ